MKKIFLLLFLGITATVYSQSTRKMKIINADVTYTDEKNSDVTISVGNVYVEIDGATIRCKRVEMYTTRNYLKAMGEVLMNQGDTVFQTSDFTDYNGELKLAKSWGNVKLTDPTMTLTTEELFFDREKQHLYYNNDGAIKDSTNVLVSKVGNYYLANKRFQALTKVVITNPDHVVESNHLEYFTNSGKAYLFEASTITSENSIVYTEKGFHDTKTKISHLTKNSWIRYDDRLIEGDSLYNNGATEFSSATGSVKITDTINNSRLKGGYAEFFRANDSAFVVNRAVAITLIEKDSMYIHGDTLLITGKPEDRLIRAYHHVKFFKTDLRGKCDSLSSRQAIGVTKMFRKPVLWSEEKQITGDVIHFLTKKETEKLDSLKVLGNAFMVQIDSSGYNQTKGRDLLGEFIDNDLKFVDIIGNGEVFHFVRNEEDELIGITKMRSSSLHLVLENKRIKEIEFRVSPDGKTHPQEEIHKNDRKLKGFGWREAEKPIDKNDIFRHDPGDDEIMHQERMKELEIRIEAQKAADKRLKNRLASLELQRKQDSIDSIAVPVIDTLIIKKNTDSIIPSIQVIDTLIIKEVDSITPRIKNKPVGIKEEE